MKVLLSILLGMMLLTSLIGFAYAAQIYQPSDGGNNCNPNSQNPNATQCGGNSDGTPKDPNPPSICGDGSSPKSPDTCLCGGGISPHGSEISGTCCGTGITPQGAEISDISPDCF